MRRMLDPARRQRQRLRKRRQLSLVSEQLCVRAEVIVGGGAFAHGEVEGRRSGSRQALERQRQEVPRDGGVARRQRVGVIECVVGVVVGVVVGAARGS